MRNHARKFFLSAGALGLLVNCGGHTPNNSSSAGLNEKPTPLAANTKSAEAMNLMTVEPITVVAGGLSIASSLKSLFGKDSNKRDLKAIRKQLEEISAQNAQILQTLGQIVAILNNLGATIRQNVRLENIFENQTQLMGEARQLYDTRLAEIEDKRAAKQASLRYQNDILPDVRDVTRKLMDEGYGYSAYDTVGHGMLMEFWMSRRLNERPALRRNDARAYLAYFDRALNPQTDGSPAKLLADASAQRDRMKTILDAADQRVGTNGWEAPVREYVTSKVNGRTTTYRRYRVLDKVTGNQSTGYTVSSRDEFIKEWKETEPSDGCRRCLELAANAEDRSVKSLGPDPSPPTADTPAAQSLYWNAARLTLGDALKDVALWSKVREVLELYRSEANEVATNS